MTSVTTTPAPNSIAGLACEHVDSATLQRLLGRLTTTADSPTAVVTAPLTGETIIELPCANEEAVTVAFSVARQAQREWAQTPASERAKVLMRFYRLVLDRRAQGLDIVQLETGKARIHANEELLDVALTSRYYARVGPRLLAPKKIPGPFPVISSTVALHHPKGVVGVISPWNYPLTLAVSDAVAALMAGNSVVIKPDIQTTLTALWAIDLLYEAGLPAGVFGVVAGEGPVVGPMITERGDFIMFTGSTGVGRQVAARCGERLVACSMELGGKNAMIVRADADIARSAEIAVRACFANSGQLCISMERMYVHRSIMHEFMDAFTARIRRMRLGNQVGWDADMGCLISERQLNTIAAHVDDAVSKGATVVAGGRARPDLGPTFYEPTVLTDVTSDMECFSNETFGPVVSVYPFDTDEEAVALANDTPYGLNGSILSRDVGQARDMAAHLHAGTININEGYGTAWASMGAPMGGFGDSGLGRRHGPDGLLKYTESQTVSDQKLIGWGTPSYLTHSQWADTLQLLVRAITLVGKK